MLPLYRLVQLAVIPPALFAVPTHAQTPSPDLAPPVLLCAAGRPIDVTTGHAAPWVMDFDGDGVRDLLVGEFGEGSFPVDRLPDDEQIRKLECAEGKLRIYRNIGTDAAPRYDGYEYLKAGGEHASMPAT